MSAISVVGEQNEFFGNIASAASDYFSLSGNAEVELVFAGESEIRALNRESRGVDRETDVLSFPSLDLICGDYVSFTAKNYPFDCNPESGAVALGSIVICDSVAEKQAEEYGHGVMRERGYLFLHGLLHLLGFDHVEEADKAKMRKAEEDILSVANLSRD